MLGSLFGFLDFKIVKFLRFRGFFWLVWVKREVVCLLGLVLRGKSSRVFYVKLLVVSVRSGFLDY